MSCFTCGKGMPVNAKVILKRFKELYEEKGIERYFYKLNETAPVMTCSKSQFKTIFTKKIKKNLKHGATYAHIKEYNPNA